MSELYKKTFRGYLIDHHSPDAPVVDFKNLNVEEYDRFFKEANINHLMLYFKDHWGNSYYDTKIGKKHNALKCDWISKIIPVLRKNEIEVNAYYCFEYDNYISNKHPEWAIRKEDGTPLKCGENYCTPIAKWGMPCYETGYRDYAMGQLKEMIANYHPDSLFIDIFGKSVCYCPTCRKKFKDRFGYELPEDYEGLKEKNRDVLNFVNDSAYEMLDEIVKTLKKIDPNLAITVNFAAHYPKKIIDKIDYLFTEPWAGNWLSGAYARDISGGKFPQLGPGDVSQVYNYQPDSVYLLAASEIAAQGCRVFFYSESMHPDGTLEHEEARKIGKAYREVEKFEKYLTDRKIIADIGIVQSDEADATVIEEPIIHNAIGRAKAGGLHRDALLGAMKLCDYSKYTWNIVRDIDLTLKKARSYKMLILPNIFNITDKLKDVLYEYVRSGGTVLSAGETGLYDKSGNMLKDFTLSELYGFKFKYKDEKFKSNVWSSYVKPVCDDIWKYCPHTTMPVLKYDIKMENNSGKTLGYFVEPAVVVTDTTWVNWGYPPPKKDTKDPAIVENTVGSGKVIYAAFDLFTMENKEFKWLKTLFNGILEKYVKPSIYLKCDTPYILGFTSYIRPDKHEIIIHEVSHMAKIASGDSPYIDGGSLKIDKGFLNIKEAYMVYPEKKRVDISEHEHDYEIKFDKVRVHQMLVIRYL